MTTILAISLPARASFKSRSSIAMLLNNWYAMEAMCFYSTNGGREYTIVLPYDLPEESARVHVERFNNLASKAGCPNASISFQVKAAAVAAETI